MRAEAAPEEAVLNARGHRHDDHKYARMRDKNEPEMCSTPEGIGTTITCFLYKLHKLLKWCSTPEGIGTTITVPVLARRLRR